MSASRALGRIPVPAREPGRVMSGIWRWTVRCPSNQVWSSRAPLGRQAVNPSMNVELERRKVQQVIEAWLQASKNGDTEALLPLMADDVVFLLPGQEPMRGRSAFVAASRSSGRKFRLVDG